MQLKLLAVPYSKVFLAGVLIMFSSFVGDARTTNCDQKFTFFFKLQYDNTFWIGEDLFGECGESNLIQIFLENEKLMVKKMPLAEFERWEWIEPIRKAMRTEIFYALEVGSKQVIDDDSRGIKLSKPKENKRLMSQFTKEFAENCAKQWNQQMQADGIDEPQTLGMDLDLVYYHPDGLYFSYQMEKVFVFPESGHLLIMTKQAKRCAGGDTMDGFMIFKFKTL